MNKKLNLIWIDLEMTGLQPNTDRIIEIATIVTDAELNILAQGPNIAVHQSHEILAQMDEWNQRTHGNSGLIRRVCESTYTESLAEQATLDFLREYCEPSSSPMCGNTISQDRRFLANYMPELEKFFHYRQIDVSTVKELARRWSPEVLAGFKKESRHLALNDIEDSISELKYYREKFFKF